MKRLQVKDLTPGMRVDTDFAVIESTVRQDKNGNDYLTLSLSDKTGRVMAVRFNPESHELERAAQMNFAHVAGVVDQFGGNLQIKIDRPLRTVETPTNLDDFIQASPFSLEKLRARLAAHINSVQEPNLRALLRVVFESDATLRRDFEDAPAARGMHHAYLHGLLQHSLEVADLAGAAADVQRGWNGKAVSRDLVVTSSLLHDIGKITELKREGAAFNYTSRGNLIGHVVLGTQIITDKTKEVRGFPPDLLDTVLHIVLAHHGRVEFGAPVAPMMPEAQIVSAADLLDVQLFYMNEAMEKAADQKTVEWHYGLEGRPKHSGRAVFAGNLGLSEPVPPARRKAADTPAVTQDLLAFGDGDLGLFDPAIRQALPVLRFALPSASLRATPLSFETRRLPVLGRVAAGSPLLADDHVEEFLDVENLGFGSDCEAFLLRVQGESMTGDGILPDDLIAVRCQDRADHGDIVVALLGDEATVKRFHKGADGEVKLMPSHPAHQPIPVPDPDMLTIRGRVVGILR